jgi:protein-serine/threonine kinase
MLYFFATGTRPFGDPQRMSGLKRRLWRDPAPPRGLRPDCPPWLQEVILRCLEVDPERRHPTAAQLAFDLRHPDAVPLTPRASKARRDGFGQVLRRRFNPEAQPRFRPRRDPAAQVDAAPIVAVAVDLSGQPPALAEALRAAVGRILLTLPGARVACVNVLRTNCVLLDTTLDAEGRTKHARRLAELRHWAEPMRLPEGRATFHVLEAVSPAAALLEYATANPVDHMVLGARCRSVRRKLLGSVAGEVAAEAPCTVTVVRPRQVGEDAAA